MRFSRGDSILKELKRHMPFTLGVSLLAGVLVWVAFLFGLGSSVFFLEGFEVIHPVHVLVSAGATAAIFMKYKKSVLSAGLIGVVGAILVGTVSDVLLPFIAGNFLALETSLHIPILESPLVILVSAAVGSLIGIYFNLFKINHALHIFLSVFASLFYLLAFSSAVGFWMVLAISLIVFLVVYIPCCISDIVFPILFVKKPCKDCGHWHD